MRRVSGFTLIEVLVALVIVAFGMGAVLAALTSSADSVQRLREKSLAEWIGFNQISTVRLTLQQPQNGSSEGDLEYAGENWHWQQTVDDIDVEGVKRITVKVRHAASGASDSDADIDWLATTVGFKGNAVSAASGEEPNWTGVAFATSGGSDGSTPATGGRGGSGTGDRGTPRRPPSTTDSGSQ